MSVNNSPPLVEDSPWREGGDEDEGERFILPRSPESTPLPQSDRDRAILNQPCLVQRYHQS